MTDSMPAFVKLNSSERLPKDLSLICSYIISRLCFVSAHVKFLFVSLLVCLFIFQHFLSK